MLIGETFSPRFTLATCSNNFITTLDHGKFGPSLTMERAQRRGLPMTSENSTHSEREAKWREELDAQSPGTVEKDFERGVYSIANSKIPPEFVRKYLDESREHEERETKYSSWMLILMAIATILAVAGFLPGPQ